jgi:hypothetical protein
MLVLVSGYAACDHAVNGDSSQRALYMVASPESVFRSCSMWYTQERDLCAI